MNLVDANTLITGAMETHGLFSKGWSFVWDSAKNRFGQCRYGSKTISMSRKLVELNDEALVRDTILHEIAHALVGPKHNHDWTWRTIAKQIGAKPERCFGNEVASPQPNYIGICQDCGYQGRRYRLTQRTAENCYHTRCRGKEKDGKMDWRKA
jgi:predicted SprT family Zn-dependent metalloprotease